MPSYNYIIVVLLLMIGLYVVMANRNLVKKVIGINVFQTAVFVLYITIGALDGGTAPILVADSAAGEIAYTNPLPHVLILTAIVVGVATTALALALVVRIYRAYGSFEENEIIAADSQAHADTLIDLDLADELSADEAGAAPSGLPVGGGRERAQPKTGRPEGNGT